MKQAITLSSILQYEQLISTQDPFILYFSTPNCNVCHSMLPKLLGELEYNKCDVIVIDAAVYPEIAGQARIFVAPTVLVMYEGKEILRESRFIDISKISRLLDIIQSS